MSAASQPPRPRIVGRYALFDEIACGGMASVHLGRSMSGAGFSRTVAIKRMHPQLARDPAFAAMFLDEARLATRIEHPNVVVASDVAETDNELLIVMDFVLGEALSKLWIKQLETGARVEPAIAVAVLTDALYGLHAAHEARDERGELLGIVHRDISPPNIMVGSDGVSRVLDFGVAKARGRSQNTVDGAVKGKLGYMAPEQLLGNPLDRRTDVYAAGVVLWELLVGKYLFIDEEAQALLKRVTCAPEPPSQFVPSLPSGIDEIVARGLANQPEDRFESAQAMAMALENVVTPAGRGRVSEWVRRIANKRLQALGRRIAAIEQVPLQTLREQGLQGAAPVRKKDGETRDDSMTNLMPLRPANERPVNERSARHEPTHDNTHGSSAHGSSAHGSSAHGSSALGTGPSAEHDTTQPLVAVPAANGAPQHPAAPHHAPAEGVMPEPATLFATPAGLAGPTSQLLAAQHERRNGRRWPLMALGLGAMMLLGGGALSLLLRPTSPAPAATATDTTMPSAAPTPAPAASATSSATPADALLSASASASAPSTSASTPPAALRPWPRSAPRPVAPAGRDDCRPPYTWDNGIKRYKRHCL